MHEQTKKQVWRTWNGNIDQDMSFVEGVTGILFVSGLMFNVYDGADYTKPELSMLWEHIEGTGTKIIAYTTDPRASFEHFLDAAYAKHTNNQ